MAVFVSAAAITDFPQCRLFAQKLVASMARGPRRLAYGTGQEVDTDVGPHRFRFRLPPSWLLVRTAGVHDLAHLFFRRGGVFPQESTELGLGLDAYPDDSRPPGEQEGNREGTLLGLSVQWELTFDRPETWGARTESDEVSGADHAIAALRAPSAAARDEAIRFAESIQVGP